MKLLNQIYKILSTKILSYAPMRNSLRHQNTFNMFSSRNASKTYSINASIGPKMIKTLVRFESLQEHKFKHNFNDTLNPLCSCTIENETITHLFLRYHFYDANRKTIKNELRNTDNPLSALK